MNKWTIEQQKYNIHIHVQQKVQIFLHPIPQKPREASQNHWSTSHAQNAMHRGRSSCTYSVPRVTIVLPRSDITRADFSFGKRSVHLLNFVSDALTRYSNAREGVLKTAFIKEVSVYSSPYSVLRFSSSCDLFCKEVIFIFFFFFVVFYYLLISFCFFLLNGC